MDDVEFDGRFAEAMVDAFKAGTKEAIKEISVTFGRMIIAASVILSMFFFLLTYYAESRITDKLDGLNASLREAAAIAKSLEGISQNQTVHVERARTTVDLIEEEMHRNRVKKEKPNADGL